MAQFHSPPPARSDGAAGAQAFSPMSSAQAGVGARSASLGAMPSAGVGAVPNAGQGAEHLSITQQFVHSRQLFHEQGLNLQVSLKTPWAIRAAQRAQVPEDPRFPQGFDKIDVHAEIEKAKFDRLAKGAIGIYQNPKKVVCPEWTVFNHAGFHACRVAYYECVIASLSSAIFQEFKDSLKGVARQAACTAFLMTNADLAALPDADFFHDCELYFGPKNAGQALQSLIETHKDKLHSQSTFVAKYDTVAYKYLFAVNDIVKTHEYWTADQPVGSLVAATTLPGSIDIKTIMAKWFAIFPKQSDTSPQSCQMKYCKDFCDLNKKMPFRDHVRSVRTYFEAIDLEVVAGQRAYTTMPTEIDVDASKPSASLSINPRDAMQASRGGGRGRPAVSQLDRRQSTDKNGQKPKYDKPTRRTDLPKGIQKKNTPGHLRCPTCGSPNNHHGLGSGINSCPVFGTKYAKPPGYVWKSVRDEPAVSVPRDFYLERLNANPKIAQNWDKAKAQKQAHVAAMQAITVDAVDDAGVDNDMREPFTSDDDDQSVSSKSSDYFVSESTAACEPDLSLNNDSVTAVVDVAAMQTEHPLERFGYMPQFFGVARFAQNNEFQAKCLLDPGGAINVISPMLANRSAIKRECMNVSIFTGKRKTATVSEMVLVLFELMAKDGSYTKHKQWFAVSDMGYEMLLGRKFCKDNDLTSFDDKLTSFESFQDESFNNAHVAAISTLPSSRSLYFARADLQPGENRNKRRPKCVIATHNPSATVNVISKNEISMKSQFSQLKCLERLDHMDGSVSVRLEFGLNRSSSDGTREWFLVDDKLPSGCIVTSIVARCIRIAMASPDLPIPPMFPEPSEAPFSSRSPMLRDGTTSSFLADFGAAVPIRDNGPGAGAAVFKAATKAMRTVDPVRFVSKHPVSKYTLSRPSTPPLSPHWRKDHANLHDRRNERLASVAALEFEAMRATCALKRSVLQNAVSRLNSKTGIVSVEQCLDDLQAEEVLAADVAAMSPVIESHNDDHKASYVSDFVPGKYVEIVGAERRQEFNGQRARLHRRIDATSNGIASDRLWEIRVLGKNQGMWLCRESRMRILSPLEQQRSRPHPATAGFDECGIDSSGVPDIDAKLLAHRQFGAEYSAALTKRIEELKTKFPRVFTNDVSEPCTFEPMRIKLKPNAVLPGKARFYRNTPKMREEVRRQIQEQLDWGAVRRCVTPHVSDVLLVKRPHMPGKFRFVVSYVKLNEAIEDEQLIMPDARSQHERLARKKIFGAFDMASYYRQLRLHKDSQYLTGFASDEGTFVYCTVPMGIKTACAHAQRVLQEALQADPVLGPLGVKNYFDDLPFAADTEDEFMFIFEAILNFCSLHKLKVNPDKSVFGVKSITHVGFVVSENGISIDPERYRDLSELAVPKSIKKVQSVLGVLNYVRNFVPHFSEKARFLTDKLVAVPATTSNTSKRPRPPVLPTSGQKAHIAALKASVADPARSHKTKLVPQFHWSETDTKMFEELKAAVLRAPMLEYLDYSKPIFVRCDASRFGAGAVLFQYDERGFEPRVLRIAQISSR